MEAAFQNSDDEGDDYHQDSPNVPLLPTHRFSAESYPHPLASSHRSESPNNIPGGYDFEYDYPPPPGSPPPPSALALPNSIGNSNGLLPTSIPTASGPAAPQPSLFRRAFRLFIPGRRNEPNQTGGGQENDGVFANVTAKPALSRVSGAPDGVGVAPEITPDDVPPVCLLVPIYYRNSSNNLRPAVLSSGAGGRRSTLLGNYDLRPTPIRI